MGFELIDKSNSTDVFIFSMGLRKWTTFRSNIRLIRTHKIERKNKIKAINCFFFVKLFLLLLGYFFFSQSIN